jgi:hypothetical protein
MIRPTAGIRLWRIDGSAGNGAVSRLGKEMRYENIIKT